MQTILAGKPRLSYSAFIAAQQPLDHQPKQDPQLLDFEPYSVAWVLQRYYEKFKPTSAYLSATPFGGCRSRRTFKCWRAS
jgi:hypothetical protein